MQCGTEAPPTITETLTILLLLLLLLLLLFLHDLWQASAAEQLALYASSLYAGLSRTRHTWTLLPNSSRALLPGSSAPSIHSAPLQRSIHYTDIHHHHQ